jgi:RNA polymerase sigma-54 factor
MKPSLQLRVSQQLVMTPQLQQALKLLQMPVLELSTQLEEALADNVMLEAEEPADSGDTPEPAADAESLAGDREGDGAEVVAGEFEEGDLWADRGQPDSRGDSWADDGRRPEIADSSGETLQEHLLWQLELEDFSPREVAIGHALVDALNEDGYLTESLDDIELAIRGDAGFTRGEIEQTLAKLQQLDPVGVGARSLSECLSLQLEQLDAAVPGRELALTLAAAHLDAVAGQDYAGLRRQLGVAEDDLHKALALLRACNPKPGAAIQPAAPDYIMPDVYVRKQDGRWVVEVNRSAAPRLRVNQVYADMLKGGGAHDTLRAQLQEARFLVRSLEIRNDTLTKVALCIVERQTEFLEHGEESMKPMVLRDVAEAVEMHESTISRVTANKYMHTPRGVFEFRYFFSSQLSGSDGSEQSSTAIRAKIKRLIGHENPEKPLSDAKLADILEEEGIKVARRTVAKYRESMRIPTSSERKRRSA